MGCGNGCGQVQTVKARLVVEVRALEPIRPNPLNDAQNPVLGISPTKVHPAVARP